MRLRAGQQGTKDARHQHPGLARTGAGFDDHASRRIAGGGVERLTRRSCAVDGVGRAAGHVDVPMAHWESSALPAAAFALGASFMDS